MKRFEYDMRDWCHSATCLIAYWPDRKMVIEELHQHLLDRQQDFINQGLDPQEAAERALEAMGDPYAISHDLAELHKPFWGYFLRACKIAFAVLAAVVFVFGLFGSRLLFIPNTNPSSFDPFSTQSYGGETGRTLHHLSKPNVSFHAEGSYFKVTDAAIYTAKSNPSERNLSCLRINMRQLSILPLREKREYEGMFSLSLGNHFYAVDSLGNTYPFIFADDQGRTNTASAFSQTGIFSGNHEFWINDFPTEGVDWVELRYDRDGRDYTLRIDLRGGVQQ